MELEGMGDHLLLGVNYGSFVLKGRTVICTHLRPPRPDRTLYSYDRIRPNRMGPGLPTHIHQKQIC